MAARSGLVFCSRNRRKIASHKPERKPVIVNLDYRNLMRRFLRAIRFLARSPLIDGRMDYSRRVCFVIKSFVVVTPRRRTIIVESTSAHFTIRCIQSWLTEKKKIIDRMIWRETTDLNVCITCSHLFLNTLGVQDGYFIRSNINELRFKTFYLMS